MCSSYISSREGVNKHELTSYSTTKSQWKGEEIAEGFRYALMVTAGVAAVVGLFGVLTFTAKGAAALNVFNTTISGPWKDMPFVFSALGGAGSLGVFGFMVHGVYKSARHQNKRQQVERIDNGAVLVAHENLAEEWIHVILEGAAMDIVDNNKEEIQRDKLVVVYKSENSQFALRYINDFQEQEFYKTDNFENLKLRIASKRDQYDLSGHKLRFLQMAPKVKS